MIVVAIIGLLAAIAIPNFVRARATSQNNACINNLRQIDGAASNGRWKQANPAGRPSTILDDLTPYIKLNSSSSIPRVRLAAVYNDPTVGVNPDCSLSTGLLRGIKCSNQLRLDSKARSETLRAFFIVLSPNSKYQSIPARF